VRAKLKAEIVDRTTKSYRAQTQKYNVSRIPVKKYVKDMGVIKLAKKQCLKFLKFRFPKFVFCEVIANLYNG